MILHGFLFRISILKNSPVLHQIEFLDSIEICGLSQAISQLRFIWEKEHSTEAVPTGIAKHTFARILKFGHTSFLTLNL